MLMLKQKTAALTIFALEEQNNFELVRGIVNSQAWTELQPYAHDVDLMLATTYDKREVRESLIEFVEKYPQSHGWNDIIFGILDANRYTINTLIASTNFSYNPIENYNMVENGTDNRTLNNAARTTNGSVSTPTINVTNTQTSQISPMNNNEFVNQGKVINSQDTSAIQQTNTSTLSSTVDTDKNVHNLTRAGNIGVTTTQQMLEQERNIARLNIVKEVCAIIIEGIGKGCVRCF